jgi:crotonobetainyl-CoA:carnitine CoA-transferase CaiB-like acyl-CoA transferase
MTQQETIIKMVLDAWTVHISRTDKLFNELTDDQLSHQASPGRNTGVYLLGHLAAVHDGMLPLLGISEKLYPQLEEVFIKNPDTSGLEKPATKDLRNYWNEVNKKLADRFSGFTAEEWFQKHSAVPAEDFIKEPHRNKLNLVLNRTTHLASHYGQMLYLK